MASRAMLTLVDGRCESRSKPRFRVLLAAKLLTTTDEQPVKVRNISATGALIEGEKLPSVDTDVIIRRGDFEVFGTVVRCERGQCGIEFDEPLADEDLWRQVNAVAARQPETGVQHWRPGLRHGPRLTAEEHEIARAWVYPSGRAAYCD